MKKSLVISGGGSKGAFAAGVVCGEKKTYDLYVGTSTGALVAILAAIGKFDLLENLYCNFTNEMIYSDIPFNKKGNISKWKAIKTLISGKSSLGNTEKLLDLIRANYTEIDHDSFKESVEIVVVVSNMTTKKPEYKSNKDFNYIDFTFWVWVSTLAYPFAETVMVEGCEYADGGYTVNFPISYAAKHSDYIDGIVLGQKNEFEEFENKNFLQGIPSMINMLLDANMNKDVSTAEHLKEDGKNIFITFTPNELTESSMMFEPKEMRKWFRMGFWKL
jgi:predicted acylesterase/phospholipase RssA